MMAKSTVVSDANPHRSDEIETVVERTNTITHNDPPAAVESAKLSPSSYVAAGGAVVASANLGLRPNDVLLGRGSGPNHSIGNIKFRALVWDEFEAFRSQRNKASGGTGHCEGGDMFLPLDPTTKNHLARLILQKVRSTGGRFLRRMTELEARYTSEGDQFKAIVTGEQSSLYEEVPSKEAIEKIKQTLRFQIDQRDKDRTTGSHLKRPAEEANGPLKPPRKRFQIEPAVSRIQGTAAWDSTANDLAFASEVSRSFLSRLNQGSREMMDYSMLSSVRGLPPPSSSLALGPAASLNRMSSFSHGPTPEMLAYASAATTLQRQEQQQLASLIAAASGAGGRLGNHLPGINGPAAYDHAISQLLLRETNELASINAASARLAGRIRQQQLELLVLEGAREGFARGGGAEPHLLRQPPPLSFLAPSSFLAGDWIGTTTTSSPFRLGLGGSMSGVSEELLHGTGGRGPSFRSSLGSLHEKQGNNGP